MSDLLQEIKGYLDSIRHNAVNAALARNVKEYEVCIKTVFDCEEAVLSLFRKLDREYWELREQFEQAQAKAERYKNHLLCIQRHYGLPSEPTDFVPVTVLHEIQMIVSNALEGES
jgi:hypothetical protein